MKKYELLQDYNTPDTQIEKGTIGGNKVFAEMFNYAPYYDTCDLDKEFPKWFRKVEKPEFYKDDMIYFAQCVLNSKNLTTETIPEMLKNYIKMTKKIF